MYSSATSAVMTHFTAYGGSAEGAEKAKTQRGGYEVNRKTRGDRQRVAARQVLGMNLLTSLVTALIFLMWRIWGVS